MSASESRIQRLRRNAERALGRSSGAEAEAALDALVSHASPGSEDALFAHRHLAELRLQRHPWRAALHLRALVAADPHDDVPHALMGLCQALLGNYRAAVAAYRRAAAITPDTPWYHHNLGHLLDVALDAPREARGHLLRAHRLEPEHDEIAASYAHCLARAGDLGEATRLAEIAVELDPARSEHQELRDWIARGAPEAEDVAATPPAIAASDEERVGAAVARVLEAAGLGASRLRRALRIWEDFERDARPSVKKPETAAAALDYLLDWVDGATRSQAAVAEDFGVSRHSVGRWANAIREALALRRADERYGA